MLGLRADPTPVVTSSSSEEIRTWSGLVGDIELVLIVTEPGDDPGPRGTAVGARVQGPCQSGTAAADVARFLTGGSNA